MNQTKRGHEHAMVSDLDPNIFLGPAGFENKKRKCNLPDTVRHTEIRHPQLCMLSVIYLYDGLGIRWSAYPRLCLYQVSMPLRSPDSYDEVKD
jgi:hypothetical protein